MMKHSPSPLITNSSSPYIVQPISRSSPELGFETAAVKTEDLSQSIKTKLSFGMQNPMEPSQMSNQVSIDNYF